MRSLLPSPPLPTACSGRESSYYFCRHTRFSSTRKLAEIIEETGSTGALTARHKSRISWEVWTLSALGILMLLLLTFYAGLKALKRRKRMEEYGGHESPRKSSPVKPVSEEGTVEDGERRSEMVFFVEEEERFGLDELLGGVADLRMQGFHSSLYTVELENGAVYAMKRLRKVKVCFEEFGFTMRRIGNLRHPNILPLVCYNSELMRSFSSTDFRGMGVC